MPTDQEKTPDLARQFDYPVRHIHLIAICGTAMGTLAGMLKAKRFLVSGSDENVYPPMSTQLQSWGIQIFPQFSAQNLNPKPDLVIVGNAVSKTNPEVEALLDSKIPYLSLPQAISQIFLEDKLSLVVAGTHGKTTTTSLLAWVLFSLDQSPSFLVGGIPNNFNSSFGLGDGKYFVIEGDEYDTAFFDKGPKFWHYRPFQSIVTSLEFDHADIYRDLNHLKESFQKFVEKIPSEGHLYVCGDHPSTLELQKFAACRFTAYGLNSACALHPEKIRFDSDGVRFDLIFNHENLGEIFSPLSGHHNLQNTLGVLALTLGLGLPLDRIKQAISSFKGVKRRQEIRGVVRGITVIDDFAHHPTAVSETISAMRNRYPNQKIWAIFEPRSNTSRRAVFQKDFAKALSLADEILLAHVHMPEKVKGDAVLNEEELVNDIQATGRAAHGNLSVDEIIEYVGAHAGVGDVLLVMSNGGFGNIHQRLLSRLE